MRTDDDAVAVVLALAGDAERHLAGEPPMIRADVAAALGTRPAQLPARVLRALVNR